jgi:hypothetical protein
MSGERIVGARLSGVRGDDRWMSALSIHEVARHGQLALSTDLHVSADSPVGLGMRGAIGARRNP